MIRIRRIEKISRSKWSYLSKMLVLKKHFKTFWFKRILFFFGKSILSLHFGPGPVHFLITFYLLSLGFINIHRCFEILLFNCKMDFIWNFILLFIKGVAGPIYKGTIKSFV